MSITTSADDADTRKEVSVVIIDLDNTLFDWVAVWHASFSAMLNAIVAKSGIPQETLEQEFKQIHQRHGTSEYAFSINELPSLMAKHRCADLTELYRDAIDAFRSARREVLHPYPTVLQTLQSMRKFGCLLVGYTESMAFYSDYRLKRLGIDLLLDFVYYPKDHQLPRNIDPQSIRRYRPEHYQLRRTIARTTPPGELKPNPALLLDIVSDVGAEAYEVIYVGDSLMKDVQMAQNAGITSVWAKYGTAQHRQEYELLRRVTHWTPEAVELEKQLAQQNPRPPDYVLENSLSEVLPLFKFKTFRNVEPERLKMTLDIWKTTIGVQQHFNDLSLRVRNFGLTLIVAMLGATALALKEHYFWLGAALMLTGLVGWGAFYLMDRFWYHQFLKGAVQHGSRVEEDYRSVLPEIKLTKAISAASPTTFKGRTFDSTRKVDLFYGAIALLHILVLVALVITAMLPNDQSTREKGDGERSNSTNRPRALLRVTKDGTNGATTANTPVGKAITASPGATMANQPPKTHPVGSGTLP